MSWSLNLKDLRTLQTEQTTTTHWQCEFTRNTSQLRVKLEPFYFSFLSHFISGRQRWIAYVSLFPVMDWKFIILVTFTSICGPGWSKWSEHCWKRWPKISTKHVDNTKLYSLLYNGDRNGLGTLHCNKVTLTICKGRESPFANFFSRSPCITLFL